MKIKVDGNALFCGLQNMITYYETMGDTTKVKELEKFSKLFEEDGYYDGDETTEFVIIDGDMFEEECGSECIECGKVGCNCEH